MTNIAFMLTGEQIRAARALARVEQTELARRASLSLETIKRLERIRGPAIASVRTLSAIVTAFASMGIYFDAKEDGCVGVFWAPPGKAPRRPLQVVSGVASDEKIQRLIYCSTARLKPAEDVRRTLGEILRPAQERNTALGVTGCLFACDGRFLQVLEGSREAVWQVYGAISSDPRHSALRLLENRAVETRFFPDWNLCCGRFASDDVLFDTEPAFADGFRPDIMSPVAALGLLIMVRDLQRVEPRSRRGQPSACAVAGDCIDLVCARTQEYSATSGCVQ